MRLSQGVKFAALGVIILMTLNSSKPRGIRNNNPLNIKFNAANDWRGQTGSDGIFSIFDRPENGIRAAAKLISNYATMYGVNTLAGIISRWAPSSENNTEAYINHAATKLGVQSDAIITKSVYPQLLEVMILHENGQQPYSMETIKAGVALA